MESKELTRIFEIINDVKEFPEFWNNEGFKKDEIRKLFESYSTTNNSQVSNESRVYTKNEVEELIAKYWYENEYDKIPNEDKEGSRKKYNQWVKENITNS